MTHTLTVETVIKYHIVVTRARGIWHSFFSLYLLIFVVVIKYVSYKFIVLIIFKYDARCHPAHPRLGSSRIFCHLKLNCTH